MGLDGDDPSKSNATNYCHNSDQHNYILRTSNLGVLMNLLFNHILYVILLILY